MAVESVYNYYQTTEYIATSGQPTREQFLDIADHDYEVIINLASPHSPEKLLGEDELVTELGMRYIHIPVEWESPKYSELADFCAVVEIFKSKKVWIHCIANYRVSAFMLYYLQQYQGYSAHDATSPIFHQWQPNQIWQTFIDNFPLE